MRIGFDKDLYLKTQKEHIIERIRQFDNKLYLEFGGKLFDDFHASRVLPGFEIDAKAKLLQNFSDIAEIVFCINASSIAQNKIRADFGITYDQDLLRTIDTCRGYGLLVMGPGGAWPLAQSQGPSTACVRRPWDWGKAQLPTDCPAHFSFFFKGAEIQSQAAGR